MIIFGSLLTTFKVGQQGKNFLELKTKLSNQECTLPNSFSLLTHNFSVFFFFFLPLSLAISLFSLVTNNQTSQQKLENEEKQTLVAPTSG